MAVESVTTYHLQFGFFPHSSFPQITPEMTSDFHVPRISGHFSVFHLTFQQYCTKLTALSVLQYGLPLRSCDSILPLSHSLPFLASPPLLARLRVCPANTSLLWLHSFPTNSSIFVALNTNFMHVTP